MQELNENEKDKLAFSLFSASKKLPASSSTFIEIAKKLGVYYRYNILKNSQINSMTTLHFPVLHTPSDFDVQKVRVTFKEVAQIYSEVTSLLPEIREFLKQEGGINIDRCEEFPDKSIFCYQVETDDDNILTVINYLAGFAHYELIKHKISTKAY